MCFVCVCDAVYVLLVCWSVLCDCVCVICCMCLCAALVIWCAMMFGVFCFGGVFIVLCVLESVCVRCVCVCCL